MAALLDFAADMFLPGRAGLERCGSPAVGPSGRGGRPLGGAVGGHGASRIPETKASPDDTGPAGAIASDGGGRVTQDSTPV